MNTYVIVSIYDKATQVYMRPYIAQTIGQAHRMFSDEANRKDGSDIGRHPQDYALFHIGNFTDGNGYLEDIEPTVIARAHEIMEPTPEDIQEGMSRIKQAN